MKQKIEISYKTILFTIFSLLFLWFLFTIKSILVLVFVSFLLAVTISPLVDKLQKFKIPRVLAIIISYVLIILLLSSFLSIIIPALIEQTVVLTETLSSSVARWPILQFDWNTLTSQLELVSKNVLGVVRIVISAFSNIITVVALMVLTFYFIYEKQNLNKYLDRLFDNAKKAIVVRVFQRLDLILGHWLRGQIFLMLIIAFMSYIGLMALGVNYALPLAILAGLLEFVPNLGPTIAFVPAAIVAWTISPLTGVGTIILYFIIQQVENYIIVPQVMKKAVGMHPLISLICLMIGGKLFGVIGVILAIPIFLFLQIIITELYFHEEKK